MTAPDDLHTAPPAPLGRRAFARVFDAFAVSVFVVPVLALTPQDGGGDGVRFPWPVIVFYALAPAIVEAWVLIQRSASPGKRLSGLAVRRRGGEPLDWPVALVRSLLAFSVPACAVLLFDWWVVLPVFAVVYLPAIWPGEHRDLPDLVASTRVVFLGDVRDDD